MTPQQLEFIRQQLIVAMRDLSGATKGQLQAWLENAQYDTKRYKRKKLRARDPETGKMVTLNNPPVPGKQSMAKGTAIPLVLPVEYSTASWRRALLALDDVQKSWLLWCYGENIRWEHQEAITRRAWNEFSQQLTGKRVAKKTMDRLRQLIWLAAQDVQSELTGRKVYQQQGLAKLVGVKADNWSHNFADYWRGMKAIFQDLDCEALHLLSKTRSRQKAAFS